MYDWKRIAAAGGLAALLFAPAIVSAAPKASPMDLIKTIKEIGPEGNGNSEAGKAWRALVESGPDALPTILAAFKGADDRKINWLQTAVDAIAEKELAAGRSLPAEKLESFVRDTKHSGRGRKAAFDLLVRVDPKSPERLLPGFLDDPGLEMRREAVAHALADGARLVEKKDNDAAVAAYRKLLASARDEDQVEEIAKRLKKLNVEVDLAAHFGFIRDWALVAPFDNVGGIGFKTAFPPEKSVDLNAVYKGKKDADISWIAHSTKDPHGLVDLNKALGKFKGATAYAFATVESPEERSVEIRAGCITALKIFLNGQEIFAREEYHHGMEIDQHVGRGKLKAGRNEILIKVCQNEQTEPFAQVWQYQVRVCDNLGGAVPVKVVRPQIKEERKPTEGKVNP
ncbi:MAG: hypothetical protein ACJ8FY_14340 [Gemmataceae bacterium]